MNIVLQAIYDRCHMKSQRAIENLLRMFHKQYTGHIEMDVHKGTVAKMENKP